MGASVRRCARRRKQRELRCGAAHAGARSVSPGAALRRCACSVSELTCSAAHAGTDSIGSHAALRMQAPTAHAHVRTGSRRRRSPSPWST